MSSTLECVAGFVFLWRAVLIILKWRPDLNVAIWISVFAIFIIAINVDNPNSAFQSSKHSSLFPWSWSASSSQWEDPRPAIGSDFNTGRTRINRHISSGRKGRFLGWWACMIQACFAYTGTEVVGVAFGEMPNLRKNIPHAIKQTFCRIAYFYVISITTLTMAIPYINPRLLGATKARQVL